MKIQGKRFACSAIIVGITTLAGCAPQHVPSPEERAMALQMQQAFLQRMQAGIQRGPQQLQSPQQQAQQLQAQSLGADQPNAAPISEEELSSKLAAFAPASVQTDIKRVKDGLKFGTQVFLDPEGEIVNFGSNSLTGDVTYFIRLIDGSFALKYTRAGSTAEPVTLAHAKKQNGSWSLQTSTGKALTGDRLIPASRGFMVARDSSAFHYAPGEGIKNISAIDGYHIAQFQNGDVASTGFILLEKDEQPEGNQLTQIVGLASSLKKTVGFGEYDDYVLMNMASGQVVSFDKGADAKKVAVGGTNCKMQSEKLRVAKCETLDFRESLYEPSGSRNDEHYFWSLFWFNTPEGAYAIAKEANTRKVTITELNTGKKAVLFERTLGIADFEALQSPSGIIRVEAQMGFTREAVEDAVSFFKNSSTQAKL